MYGLIDIDFIVRLYLLCTYLCYHVACVPTQKIYRPIPYAKEIAKTVRVKTTAELSCITAVTADLRSYLSLTHSLTPPARGLTYTLQLT